ncbi:MAG TPA: Glu/Leu/Phe/Val dehydrogenase dimerization domain-containing protein [Sphingomonas sp.]|nr:Glu/Leu/Phe/Val dehydrogenase dimerization domain-containing protein [Sphingomonas sp.]
MVLMTSQPPSPAQVHMVHDAATGLEGIIVLHSTVLGPAAGGCRYWSYPSASEMAVDAFRLAEGMSYKNALADLPLGGGKAVLRRTGGAVDRSRLFEAFGRAVEGLRGDYVTAEDVGTSVEDMRAVARATRHVAGLPPSGRRPGGDPSPWTARGVFLSMKEAVRRRLDRELADCTVAIQGVGHVGAALAVMLRDAGAKLLVADIDPGNVDHVVRATGATALAPDAILAADADVFAPCALGGVLSHETIGRLRARVVCGAANNQLATSEDGARLADKGVLYAPDYVVNAGGIINVAAEYLRWSNQAVLERVMATGERLMRVLDLAAASGLPGNLAADQLARSTIAARAVEMQPQAA